MTSRHTRYARSGDVSIAYQVAGDGPFDVVFVPGFLSHVELGWSTPGFDTILTRLASFSRLLVFDKRGTGLSDQIAGVPPLETRMDDVRAVMDAVGSSRAAIVGLSEGAPMSLLFAATYPARVAGLVLLGGFPRELWAPDYPWGRAEEQDRAKRQAFDHLYGSRDEATQVARALGRYGDAENGLLADYFRMGGSPGALDAIQEMLSEMDVRPVLPAIRVPTLLVHGTEDLITPLAGARYMAEHIAGATVLELPGEGHLPAGAPLERAMDEIERFLEHVRDAGGWEEPEPDRVLATVLFTDIVGSSERAARLGDRAWRELLARHHAAVRRQLVRYRGREMDAAGDGFFASFDGPARAIRCAQAIVEGVAELGLEVRAGLHTGECELLDGKVTGIAVNTGARVASEAAPGDVLVSGTVRDLVAGSGLAFADRGLHELKGVPGEWRLFAVEVA